MKEPISPVHPATAWYVQVAVNDDTWGYLDAYGGVSSSGDGVDRRWFDSPEEAEAAWAVLRQEGREAAVVSNARW